MPVTLIGPTRGFAASLAAVAALPAVATPSSTPSIGADECVGLVDSGQADPATSCVAPQQGMSGQDVLVAGGHQVTFDRSVCRTDGYPATCTSDNTHYWSYFHRTPGMAALAGYTAFAALAYGLLLNLWTWPFLTLLDGTGFAFTPGAPIPDNLRRLAAFTLTTSLSHDIPRAILNSAPVLVTGPVVLLAPRRAARRAGFGAPVTFAEPAR